MTSKNNTACLLYYVKLCVSFQIHRWIRIGVTVRKHPSRVKIGDFCLMWPWNLMGDLKKTIAHFFYTTSSFVHHFKAMGEFKLKLQSGSTQFRSKLVIFCSWVTLKFNGWPPKTIGHLFYVISTFVHYFIATGEYKLELLSRNSQYQWVFLAMWPWNLTDDLEKQ